MGPDRRLPASRAEPIIVQTRPGAGDHDARPLPPWRSLRWRLTFFYTALLAVILLALGGVLLVTVSQLLLSNAYQTFNDEARAAALFHHTQFVALSTRRNAQNECLTPYTDAFQTIFSDPLTQPPTNLQAVALLDRTTGMTLAPLAAFDSVPATLQADQLQALRHLAMPVSTRDTWEAAVARAAAVAYHTSFGGAPGAVVLIAYDYHDCAGKTYPAVLLLARSFASTQATIGAFEALLGISVGALFVLGLAVGVPLTQASLGPLARVSAAARRLAAGDLSQRVGLRARRDEVGQVGQTFDEMADRLQTLITRLQASDEHMRQFLNDASHELRSPIQAIGGSLDVVLRGGFSDARDVTAQLRNAKRETERIGRLVADLLTLARFDVGRPLELAWTDLGQVAGDAVDVARLLAGERVVTLGGDPGVLALVDADRIKQVLVALLDNALRYGRQDAQGAVQVAVWRRGAVAVMIIQDNGPGIPPELRDVVFERFNRGAQSGHDGSGLGLAIARTIVASHGGTIHIADAPVSGARFVIALPVQGPPISPEDLLAHPTVPLLPPPELRL